MEDSDFVLALQLQELWETEDKEAAAAAAAAAVCAESSPDPSPLRPLSVVDEAWELLDPSPDVHGLFVQFNETLFWGRLAAVEVSWSPRMTLCAGVCKYEGKGGMCSIRLSEPLLKLRPRKDLVETTLSRNLKSLVYSTDFKKENYLFISKPNMDRKHNQKMAMVLSSRGQKQKTLLHEMIHALLFVTNNDKDRESHGPEFCKHMRRINRLTGANVTIYHSFHDEVDLYRQHWWRCNGPCRNRKPYFGYVKRSMNRAPSARDFWWVEHQETCGGTFTKVKEPENFSKKSKEKTQPTKLPNSDLANKGKTQTSDMQDLMPFSGKGYRLGGGDRGLSENSTNFSSSVRNSETPGSQHRSVMKTIPVPKNEIKFEKSPRSGIFFPLYTDDASEKINLASKREFPKLSVANTKAYKNVSGSPVKIARVVEEKPNQDSANGKRIIPLYNRPPKQICLEQTTAAQAASEKKSSECSNTVQQWPKTEDRTAFENYFIKKGSTDVTFSINTPMKTKAETTVSSASSSTAVRQDKKVSCPVCETEVLESKINEHLDSCLA